MIKIIYFILVSIAVISCSNNPKDVVTDNKIALRTDTTNIVKLTDTLVIYESTCRGCAYERSTNFAISDSMNIIKLSNVITTDNSPADMDGGSINKDLILVPVKPGITIMKLYKFWTEEKNSSRFSKICFL